MVERRREGKVICEPSAIRGRRIRHHGVKARRPQPIHQPLRVVGGLDHAGEQIVLEGREGSEDGRQIILVLFREMEVGCVAGVSAKKPETLRMC